MASRRTPPTRRRRGDEPTFPVIPIAIGVVLVGFAIGAAIPALRGSGSGAKRALPAATATPTALPTPSETPPAPRVRVTIAPAATARPTATPTVTPLATASPKVTATPEPSPIATVRVTPVPKATSAPAERTPSPSPIVQNTPKPESHVVAHVTPRPRVRPVPVETEASDESDMESLASAAVRRYLNAIIAGDSTAARAVLDVPAGSDGANLSEESFLDPESRILDVRAHASSGDAAQVEADLQSGKGNFFAHFSVKKTDKGVMIVEHDSIKP